MAGTPGPLVGAPVAGLAGYAAFMFSNKMWWGCMITTVCSTVFAYAIAKGTRSAQPAQ